MPLEDDYVGDEAFAQFIHALEPELRDDALRWSEWPQLISLCGGDESIARGVYWIASEQSIDWMQSRAPVLDGLSAVECLAFAAGRDRLKEAIIRFGGMT